MANLVLICPRELGHLLPMSNLGSHLQRRGHRVTVLSAPGAADIVQRHGLAFQPLQMRPLPAGTIPFDGIVHRLLGARIARWFCHLTDRVLDQGPRLLRPLQPDAIVADSVVFGGTTLAEHLRVPFITVYTALNTQPSGPRDPSDYSPEPGQRPPSVLALVRGHLCQQPVARLINRYRHQWNLPPLTRAWDTLSTLAQISQGCSALDFPRSYAVPQLQWVGSLTRDRTVQLGSEFPWERLDGRPVIYATLGTIDRKTNGRVLARIAQACVGLPYQLVISGANAWQGQQLAEMNLPGRPLVVPFTPLSILARTTLLVGHGGMNTTVEALSSGLPMLLLPHGADQPGVAARVAFVGAGLSIDPRIASVADLRTLILRLLVQPSFRERAREVGAAVVAAGGASRAADVVESVLTRSVGQQSASPKSP